MFNMNPAKYNLDEVVFANRNQAYGAYAIRKEYTANVNKAIVIVLCSLSLLPVLGYFKASNTTMPPLLNPEKQKEVVRILDIVLEPIQQATAAASSMASSASANSGNYRITPDHKIIKAKTTVQVASAPSNPHVALGVQATGLTQGNILGALTGPVTYPVMPAKSEVKDVVDVMPTFSYGNEDLYAYLGKKMNYPEIARRLGKEGKVLVVFEVDELGNVGNVQIEKGVGFGCDEEAIRVVSAMPKWNPGIHNGVPVPVRIRLPISFMLD